MLTGGGSGDTDLGTGPAGFVAGGWPKEKGDFCGCTCCCCCCGLGARVGAPNPPAPPKPKPLEVELG